MRALRASSRLLPTLLLLAAMIASADAGFFSWWPFSKATTTAAPELTTELTEDPATVTVWPETTPWNEDEMEDEDGTTPEAQSETTSEPETSTPETSLVSKEQQSQYECVKVHDMAAKKRLIATLKLQFYYGSSPSAKTVVELNNVGKLMNSLRWKRDRCTVFFIYGSNQQNINNIIRAYVRRQAYNVVVLDWSDVAALPYSEATAHVVHVAAVAARAMDVLGQVGAGLCQAVGVGLSAHLAGHINRRMRHPFKHVVGVDPSGPLFETDKLPCELPLNASDASCVSTVHTKWDEANQQRLLGHAAFFPHGIRQSKCTHKRSDMGACSERRALALWAEAVSDPKALVGRHCLSWESFRLGLCDGNPTMQMRLCNGLTGRFYLRTNAEEPFGLGVNGASPQPHDSTQKPSRDSQPDNGWTELNHLRSGKPREVKRPEADTH